MGARDILLFANPISGRGRARVLARLIAQRLRYQGYRVKVHVKDPGALEAEDLAEAVQAVVVIGGDGTLRAVADRLRKTPASAPIIAVPMGTANLLARQLQLPRITTDNAADYVAQTLRARNIVRYDAALANGVLWLLIAGVGFDGQVVHELARHRTGPIRYASYLLPAARALGSYKFRELSVEADGEEVFHSEPAIAFVANSREYGTGIPILPEADPSDRWLDVCVLPCRSRAELLQWSVAMLAGTHLSTEGVVSLRAKSVRIESAEPVPVQIDGDAAGFTPLVIDLLPEQLSFMVPGQMRLS